jgi:hypothetical protein
MNTCVVTERTVYNIQFMVLLGYIAICNHLMCRMVSENSVGTPVNVCADRFGEHSLSLEGVQKLGVDFFTEI